MFRTAAALLCTALALSVLIFLVSAGKRRLRSGRLLNLLMSARGTTSRSLRTRGGSDEWVAEGPRYQGQPNVRRILGMQRRVFFLIAAILALLTLVRILGR